MENVEVFFLGSTSPVVGEKEITRMVETFQKEGKLKFCYICGTSPRLYLFEEDRNHKNCVCAALHHAFPGEEPPETLGRLQEKYRQLAKSHFIGAGNAYCRKAGPDVLFGSQSCRQEFGVDQPRSRKEADRLLNLLLEELRKRNILQPKAD